MRQSVNPQLPLMPALRAHPHLAELEEISRILDQNPEIAEAVRADLVRHVRSDKGRKGLSGDQVLRMAFLYQSNSWPYEDLAFHLCYHAAYRAFCRLSMKEHPSSSTLQRDIARIRPETWNRINDLLIGYAAHEGIEDGSRTRTDCTAVEANIHHPSDASLLCDCVRELTRRLERARNIVHAPCSDHRRRAKKRLYNIRNARKRKQRVKPYQDLLKVTKKTLGYATDAAGVLKQSQHPAAPQHLEPLQKFIELTEKVIDQTERRVLRGESVPAGEKIVSIFEPHTNIICKDGRDTLFGHKVCLTTGASNLITDCVVLDGNPPDSELTVEMMRRHVERFGKPPEQAAFDGGFYSKKNLRALKQEVEIGEVAFSKARGADLSEMVKDSWVYRRLRNFRAGVEGVISFVKRAFGMRRCPWRGKRAFEAYVRCSLVAANLLVLARRALR